MEILGIFLLQKINLRHSAVLKLLICLILYALHFESDEFLQFMEAEKCQNQNLKLTKVQVVLFHELLVS